MVDIIEFIIHVSTFIVVLMPVAFIIKIYRESKQSEFVKQFMFLTIALIVLAFPHLGHALGVLGINILPSDPLGYLIVDHLGVILSVIAFGRFLYWFEKKYVSPIYSKKK